MVLAATCGCQAGQPGRVDARLILLPHDTVQFTAGAWARPCAGRRGFVLAGAQEGNGVLLWLHSPDSADSLVRREYLFLARGDTTTPRGVVGAVRYMLKTADRGVTLDSGVVTVSLAGGRIGARARGSGIDPTAGRRVALDASFNAVPMAADTVDCRVQL